MKETTWDQLPTLDWKLGKQLAGNNLELAQDILIMLTESLPANLKVINQLHAKENYPELEKEIHKLHGAVAYSGAARLKKILAYFETQLKTNALDNLPLASLNEEIINLLKERSIQQLKEAKSTS